jgi:hypothetical protein
MEIVEGEPRRGEELVQVAYADTREEAALIRGLLREEGIRSLARPATLEAQTRSMGLLTRSPKRIYVHRERAARARELLGEVMVEDPLEAEIPESANAEHLADAAGHKPRDYNVIGAYARAWLVAAIVLGLILAFFLLVH